MTSVTAQSHAWITVLMVSGLVSSFLFNVCIKSVVPKRFLITYHLWVPYCKHVSPCSRKSQCSKYHLIKSAKRNRFLRCKCRFLSKFLRVTSQHTWIPKYHPISDLRFWSHANNLPLRARIFCSCQNKMKKQTQARMLVLLWKTPLKRG